MLEPFSNSGQEYCRGSLSFFQGFKSQIILNYYVVKYKVLKYRVKVWLFFGKQEHEGDVWDAPRKAWSSQRCLICIFCRNLISADFPSTISCVSWPCDIQLLSRALHQHMDLKVLNTKIDSKILYINTVNKIQLFRSIRVKSQLLISFKSLREVVKLQQ